MVCVMLKISKDHIAGLTFLLFSLVYGYYARDIALMPGDDYQPFNAQTLPNALAILGVILSIALLVTAKKDFDSRLDLTRYQFSLIGKLLFLIVLFGVSLEWLGFVISTILFLIAGFWLLGERRPKILFSVSIIFAVLLWFILTQLLDIYLAQGRLFTLIGG